MVWKIVSEYWCHFIWYLWGVAFVRRGRLIRMHVWVKKGNWYFSSKMYPHSMSSVLLDCVHENLWCLIKKRVGEAFKYMWILCQNKPSPQEKKQQQQTWWNHFLEWMMRVVGRGGLYKLSAWILRSELAEYWVGCRSIYSKFRHINYKGKLNKN